MGHTVLVVEDGVELCEMLCQALELSGYVVIGARDGQDALDEMNGWDFVDQLRQRARFAAVPIIVHSSAPGPPPSTVARVLKKPVPFDGLLAAVQEHCAL